LAGLFVLAMLGLVLGILVLLSPGLLTGYTLRAYFLDADGLDSGIDVMQEGFVIGRVRSLEPVFRNDADRADCPNPTTARAPDLPCFRATLSIQQHWPVPSDSVAQLAPAGVLRGNIIRIVPGTAATTFGAGSHIPTIEREPDLAMQISATMNQAQRTIDDFIRPTLTRLQERIQGLLAMLSDDQDGAGELGADLGQGIGAVLNNLVEVSDNIEQSLNPKQIQEIMGAVQTLSENLAKVSTALPSQTEEIQGAVARYAALADELQQLVQASRPSVQGSLDDVEYLLQELSAALAPILTNIESASRNLSALSRELREDPISLLRGQEQEDQSPWFSR
jgi:phospholipid/cholesterol/gamma-HCH transport system substrate-binding protein